MGALDPTNGKLTALGRLMAQCPLIPQLSRVLLEASRLRCLDPVISIISMLSTDGNIFVDHLQDREASTQSRRLFMDKSGDHLTLLNIYRAFSVQRGPSEQAAWCKKHAIDYRALKRPTTFAGSWCSFATSRACNRQRLAE